MTFLARLTVLLAALLVLSSCIKKEDFEALQLRVAQQETANDAQGGRISDLASKLEAASDELTTVRPNQADLWSEIEGLKVDMAALKGDMQELQRRMAAMDAVRQEESPEIAGLKEQLDTLEMAWRQMAAQLDLDVEALAAQAQAQAAGAPANATAPGMPMANATAPAEGLPPDAGVVATKEQTKDPAKVLYEQAMREFQNRNYKAAQSIWEEFSKTFSGHPLRPNALFWQGECFYQMGDYANAILAYQEVLANYSKSAKYPAALLKQGVSFKRIGKDKAGDILLKDLMAKFPESPEARRAKSYLGK